MRVEREQWGKIPLLHVVKEDSYDKEVPTVFFLHGHTSAKEHNLHYAYNLAKRGVRVILPDAHLHGEREKGFYEIQLNIRFWETVLTTVEEVGKLKEKISRRFPGAGEIGLAGTSM